MAIAIRQYEARDFGALYRLDQVCFPPGISYSKFSLQYFLNLPAADCLAEANPPLAHIITLDVAEEYRREGVGTSLLAEMEKHFQYHGVHSVLLETAVDNERAIAFWLHHGYRTEAVLQRSCLARFPASEMCK